MTDPEKGVSGYAEGQATQSTTQDMIAKSRAFFQSTLLPDLDRVTGELLHHEQARRNYQILEERLDAIYSSSAVRPIQNYEEGKKEGEQGDISMKKTVSTLAHLGQGVHLTVDVDTEALIMVSLGLRESNMPGSAPDSGLYVQLTSSEAITFARSKVEILTKRIKLAKDKEAFIQGHVDLTTQSIQQLERLELDSTSTMLDHLQT